MKKTFAVERIEGQWAILETASGDSFQFPMDLLPGDISEGVYLDFEISINPEAASTVSDEIAQLRNKLRQAGESA